MALMGCSGNDDLYCYSIDDNWGFDLRTEEEEEEQGNAVFGFPAADGCFYGHLEMEFQSPNNTSTSGPAPAVAADGSVTRHPCQQSMAVIDPNVPSRSRRRAKSRKNQEDIETQRMTHIAVERNRRKQMNEYLSVIRSIMPESYAQRGDQASIVGGAINFVKELEQQLQTLGIRSVQETGLSSNTVDMDELTAAASQSSVNLDVEVSLANSHASIKVRSGKRSRQLLELVKGLQTVGLTVLHLNANTVGGTALYSLSVKVEDDCKLTSGDEIATAVHQILGTI